MNLDATSVFGIFEVGMTATKYKSRPWIETRFKRYLFPRGHLSHNKYARIDRLPADVFRYHMRAILQTSGAHRTESEMFY